MFNLHPGEKLYKEVETLKVFIFESSSSKNTACYFYQLSMAGCHIIYTEENGLLWRQYKLSEQKPSVNYFLGCNSKFLN